MALNGKRAELAEIIHDAGIMVFGDAYLKHHEESDAPPSKVKFHFRTEDNPNPGPLRPAHLRLISELFWEIFSEELDFRKIDYIAGVPNAGDPIADAIMDLMPAENQVRRIHLGKTKTEDGKRLITAGRSDDLPGAVLLVDDLITKGGSKFEAIDAIQEMGHEVTCLAVILDRQQGGAKSIMDEGIDFLRLMTLNDLLDHLVQAERIERKLSRATWRGR